MTKEAFRQLTEKGIVLLDGATGTNMMKAGMPRNACPEQWILEQGGEAIKSLQKGYAEAGSQIVYAPTFSANRVSLERHGLQNEVEKLNKGLAALTREAVGPDVLIAGDLTTPGEPLDPVGELEEEELQEAYREQVSYLAEAGVDLIVAETLMDVREAEIALKAVRQVSESLPFICTLTVTESGRSIFGGSAVDLVKRLQDQGADAAGINCSMGPDTMAGIVANMAAVAKIPVIAKPNAGIPKSAPDGSSIYDMTPEYFAECMEKIVDAGAGIIGGCCGTTPEFIRLLSQKFRS